MSSNSSSSSSTGPTSSWISVSSTSDFPIQNIPFGIASYNKNTPRPVSAIGEYVSVFSKKMVDILVKMRINISIIPAYLSSFLYTILIFIFILI